MKGQQNTIFALLMLGLVSITKPVLSATSLTGAGGTFPAPVYARWAADYQKIDGSMINYQGIGSSGGVKQIIANTVDFGASDAPMTDEDLKKQGLFQFPTVIGGIVLAVNLPGIQPGQLLLDGKTVGDIYLGNIKRWNDPAIAKLNPNIPLPASHINVVRRADGSGTSYVFTSYLSKVNGQWQKQVGKGNTVNWPIGLGGKGNDGVAAFVQRLPGAIGFVEYAYAKQNNLTYTGLLNATGKAVQPDASAFKAAAAGADWQHSFAQDLTWQQGDKAWPISSTTFILIHRQPAKAENVAAVLKFFDWAYQQGNQTALSLDYAPLPSTLVSQIRTSWTKNIRDGHGHPLYP